MCDRGMIENDPNLMKLEGLIAISTEVQNKMTEGVSKLIGESVIIGNLLRGQYPDERPAYDRNTVTLCTSLPLSFRTEVATFSLKQLSGCCGVLVSYHTRVAKRFQNKGINSFLQEIKAQIAKDNGYTMLLATVTKDNAAQIHILEKHGWVSSSEFVNRRTTHSILVFTKILS